MTLSKKHFQKLFSLHTFYLQNGLNLDEQSLHEEYEFWKFSWSAEGKKEKKALINKH